MEVRRQSAQLDQVAAAIHGSKQVQLLAFALPHVLHLGRRPVVVQRVPGAGFEFLGPGHHRIVHRCVVVSDDKDRRGIDAQHHLDAFGIQRHVAQGGIVDEVFQVGQTLGHRLDVGLRNAGRLGEEGFRQGIRQDLDGGVLVRARHADQGQALAQTLQQPRQLLDHQRAIAAIGLGAGRPHQVGRRLLEHDGVGVLRAVAHGGQCQHLGPGLEQELADLVAHRHVAQHGAQLNGVLDGQRLALLYLLGHTDQA